MRHRTPNTGHRIVVIFLLFFFAIAASGCDSFVRKFTRKSKKNQEEQVELVLAPEEYKSDMTKEDYYRQYLLYWKSWQGELIESLGAAAKGEGVSNFKKQKECINQAISNLVSLRALLVADLQNKLDKYMVKMNNLRDAVVGDPYGRSADLNAQEAERLRRHILNDFSYKDVKSALQ